MSQNLLDNFINANELDRSHVVRVNTIPFPSKKYLPEVDPLIISRMIEIDYNVSNHYVASDSFKKELREFIVKGLNE